MKAGDAVRVKLWTKEWAEGVLSCDPYASALERGRPAVWVRLTRGPAWAMMDPGPDDYWLDNVEAT